MWIEFWKKDESSSSSSKKFLIVIISIRSSHWHEINLQLELVITI